MTWTLRAARADDVDAIAGYEVEIARISFGDDAVDDPAVHARKLERGLEKSPGGMVVADDDDGGRVVGWLWMAVNQNFLTGERYANFRSLAVDPAYADASAVAEALLERGLAYATEEGAGYVVGKVAVGNVAMRVLYQKHAFAPAHLTMQRSLP
jgi:GNAT superfamily N-acetyltransferase